MAKSWKGASTLGGDDESLWRPSWNPTISD